MILITFKWDKEQYLKLKNLAKSQERSVSNLFRVILNKYLEDNKVKLDKEVKEDNYFIPNNEFEENNYFLQNGNSIELEVETNNIYFKEDKYF